MFWKNRKAKQVLPAALAALAAVFLGSAVYWLVDTSRDETALPTQSPEKARQESGGATQPEEEHAVSRVEIEVERIITGWCDAEAGSFRPQDSLEGLWLNRFPMSPPYNPRGIIRLVNRIHDNDFFRDCETARRIGPGFFVGGGGIQTVRDLNDFLTPCGGGT